MKRIISIIFVFLFLIPFCFSLSNNSEIIPKYESEINFVLQNYPELENTTIFFTEKEISHTMQSKPKLNFLFKQKENREYKIILNNGTKSNSGMLVINLNSTQRIGIFSHEIGHIVDYESMSNFGIISFGIQYIFPNSKRKIEHRVDEIAINHGFGKELIEFTKLAFYGENVPEKYKKKKFKYYYSPEELENLQNLYENSSLE